MKFSITKTTKRFLLPAVLAFSLIAPVSSVSAPAEAAGSCPTAQCAQLIVHYKRNAPTNYGDWGLWLWAFKG
ncbi:MAG: hypothetical protein EBZ87_06450, partial [Microbacteriaceae bacterium]|nr:hypothetical protein [Microbacteriaceae bacterium]